MRPALVFTAIPLLALTSCVEFNAECSPPIEHPEYVVTYLAQPVPVARAEVRTKESALGDVMCDAFLAALQAEGGKKPQIAIDNAGDIRDAGLCITRTELGKGPLTRLVLKDTIAFSDQLGTVEVTERELFDILEHGVSTLSTGANPGGQFLQVSGMSYEVDCSKSPEQVSNVNGQVVREERGQRVRSITIGDRTIQRDEASETNTIVVALSDFLGGGGDNFLDLKGKTFIPSNPERYTYNVLEDYLHALGASAQAPARVAVDPQKPRIVLTNCE